MKINRRKFVKLVSGLAAGISLMPLVKLRGYSEEPVYRTTESVPNPAAWKDTELNLAWIGHSTVLINLYGTVILTDPVFFERIGLYFLGMTFGPARYSAPALEADQIPKPDVVLISHAHMDHMDYESLLHITDRFPNQLDCITAYNTADVIADLEWKSLTEIDWGEDHSIHGTNFHALEVKHFGWRYPWEKDRSRGYMTEGRSYNAYIISKNGKKIFFGGDTAYCELFNWAKQENIDIAIMPVGAYNPWRKNHCNPEEALIMAAEHMNAKIFIPIHCNTFRQGKEPIEEPMAWLLNSSVNYDIELGMKNIGQTLTMVA